MFRLPIVKFFNRIFNRVTITVVLVALQVLWLLWAFWAFTAGRVWLNGMLKALRIVIVLYLVCQKYIIDGVVAGAVKG